MPKMSEEPLQTLNRISSETVNITKLANLIGNTKDYGQITLNTKPHSDPLNMAGQSKRENLRLVRCYHMNGETETKH